MKILFDYEELKNFLEEYCQDSEGTGSYIYLEDDKILMKTHFMIHGKIWDEIEELLKGKIK